MFNKYAHKGKTITNKIILIAFSFVCVLAKYFYIISLNYLLSTIVHKTHAKYSSSPKHGFSEANPVFFKK